MAVHLRVDPDALRDVGGRIAAAPQESATAPSADITSPANDSVSTVASHGISAAIAVLGAHSVFAGMITGAASRLVAATADTYDDQEVVNDQALQLGVEAASGPVTAPQMPALTAPAVPAITPPGVGAPPTNGKQIAQLIHGGAGASSWLAAADGLDSHAGHLRDSSDRLTSAVAAMASVWDSQASPHAESFLDRLGADYGRHADNTAAVARAVRTQADYFQQVKHEVPTPAEFDDLERRLKAADVANRQSRGLYSGVVAALQTELAAKHSQAMTAYASYGTRTAAHTTGTLAVSGPLDPTDIPVGPDDTIVGGDTANGPRFQQVDSHGGGLPQEPPPPAPPEPVPPPGAPVIRKDPLTNLLLPADAPPPSPPSGSDPLTGVIPPAAPPPPPPPDPITATMLPPPGGSAPTPALPVNQFYNQLINQLPPAEFPPATPQQIVDYMRAHPGACSTWDWTKAWGAVGIGGLGAVAAAPGLIPPGIDVPAAAGEAAALSAFGFGWGDVLNCATR